MSTFCGQMATLLTIGVVLCGCSSLPQANSGNTALITNTQDRLAAHVWFLAQPKLAGRETRSAGARMARRYIEEKFGSYGLVPWAQEKSFEVSYGFGKNIVGVLPGSDTNLSNEIVLLSAHYDHVGKDDKGKICPGAADNASGVATLLETARQLGIANPHPKRTIAFAAFDSEEMMLLGSVAFSCRPDVENAKIVAVVNVDMLGRDFMEVVQNSIFVTGTENRPALLAQVRQFGNQAGIRVLPITTELVGPSSDHAAFINRGALCLFFTCGTFDGYHRPTDTPDRLNYINLNRSAQVVLETVGALANESSIQTADPRASGQDELQTMQTVLSDVCADPKRAGIKTNDTSKVLSLKTNIEKALAKQTNDPAERERILVQAARTLMPYLGDGQGVDSSPLAPVLAHFYLNYQRELMDAEKQLVALLLTHPPSLVHGLPPFAYVNYDLRDRDISLRQTGINTFALHALVHGIDLKTFNKTRIWPVKSFGVAVGAVIAALDCEGTRDELADYYLLQLMNHQTNAAYAQATRKILRTVTGTEPVGNPTNWLNMRLAQTGFSQKQWLLACVQSTNSEVAIEALRAGARCADARIVDAACKILLDRNAPVPLRINALHLISTNPSPSGLITLSEVLDDTTQVNTPQGMYDCQKDYPLIDNVAFDALRSMQQATPPSKETLGQQALKSLKTITKKDFGNNPEAWKRFAPQN